MRTAGYCFVGYLIVSFGLSGLYLGGASGVVGAALAVGALVWLVRAFRRGPRPVAALAYDGRAGARRLARRAADLAMRLPEDPLENSGYVATSFALRGDPEAQRRAEADYGRWRARLARLTAEVAALEEDAERSQSPALADEERRLATALRPVAAYADILDDHAARAAAEALA